VFEVVPYATQYLKQFFMSTISTWLGNAMENVFSHFFHTVQVTETRLLTAQLKLISFKGELNDMHFAPGQDIKIRVNDLDFRYYTPSYFNREKGICQLLVYLNKKGPGSNWAETLETGDEVKLLRPEGGIRFDHEASHHFFFGDETSIGLFNSLKDIALREDKEYFGVLELSEENQASLDALKLMVDTVTSHIDNPAGNAIAWMEDMHPDCWAAWKDARFYLTGRAASIQRFKIYLQQKGVSNDQIKTAAYWADGKKGL
jgi:NADPH-dependent ferric siderophore reductase